MKIKLITLLIIFMFAILLMPNIVNAAEGDEFTIDDVKYTVISEEEKNNTVKVSGYEKKYTTLTIPEIVNNNGTDYIVTTIGRDSLSWYNILETIHLPQTIKSIEWGAFYGCRSLKNIKLPDNLTEIEGVTFYLCTSLENIELPDTIKSIGDYAFGECDKLTNVKLPSNLSSIGRDAFKNCTSLAVPIKYVTNTLTNISCDVKNNVYSGNEDYKEVLIADKGYILPETITVKTAEKELVSNVDYTYDQRTGVIVIFKSVITGQVEIIAKAIPEFVLGSNDGLSFIIDSYHFVFEDTLKVYIDDELLESIHYNMEDRKLTISKEYMNTLKLGIHTLKVKFREIDYDVEIEEDFAITSGKINNIIISNLTKPEIGNVTNRVNLKIPADAQYEIVSATWLESQTGETDSFVPVEDNLFKANHYYRLKVILKNKYGYEFENDLNATINNSNANIESITATQVVVSYVFEKLESQDKQENIIDNKQEPIKDDKGQNISGNIQQNGKDETPNTGVIQDNNINYIYAIIILSGIGIIALIRKNINK